MLCKDQRSYSDEHDECRYDDALKIGGKHGSVVFMFVEASLGHEYGVVVALSEDECGEDDVDDVELYM